MYIFICFIFLISGTLGLNECATKGGFCTINEENCFNSRIENGLCGTSNDTVCCLPNEEEMCTNEVCGGIIHDCVNELTYNYRHPIACKLYERCGINKEVYLNVCTSIGVKLICCAKKSIVTATGEIVGPNGDIEGIMFNGIKITNDPGELQFYIAGVAAVISLIIICILVWTKLKAKNERREWNQTRGVEIKLVTIPDSQTDVQSIKMSCDSQYSTVNSSQFLNQLANIHENQILKQMAAINDNQVSTDSQISTVNDNNLSTINDTQSSTINDGQVSTPSCDIQLSTFNDSHVSTADNSQVSTSSCDIQTSTIG